MRTTTEITGCISLSASADTCKTCTEGFLLTDDLLKCLPVIPNCFSHGSSTKVTETLQCSKCLDTFVYSTTNNSCTVPAAESIITNCIQYQNDSTTCTSCSEGFYFDSTNNKCLSHRLIPDCEQYSGSSAQTCLKCFLGFALLSNTKSCLKGDLIPNCKENLADSTCKDCEEGFYGPLCAPIPFSQKCLQVDPVDSNKCLKCKPNHYLISSLCQPALNYEISYCQSLGTHSCAKCRPNSLLTGVKNFNICQPSSLTTNFSIQNCIKFNASDSQCIQCREGYLLDNNACLKYCPASRSSVILKQYSLVNSQFYLSAVNKCVSPTTLNNLYCKIFVPDSKDPTKLICARCKTGTIPVLKFDTLSHHMYSLSNSLNFTPDSYDSNNSNRTFEVNGSLSKPGLTCAEGQNLSLVSNCEYWVNINSYLKCAKCRYGFRGLVSVTSGLSYVSKCLKDFDCSQVKLPFNSGLDMHLSFQTAFPFSVPSALISCYYCKSITEIPFLYASNTAGSLTLSNYKMTNSGTLYSGSSSDTDEDYNNQCHNPGTFKFYNVGAVSSFPTDCGIGMVDPSKNISASGVSEYLQCLTCKPGFKATFSGNYISACQTIDNCEQSWEFGQCSLCKIGYLWKFDSSANHIDKASCLAFTDRYTNLLTL